MLRRPLRPFVARRARAGLALSTVLLAALLVPTGTLTACARSSPPPKPKVLCTLENPATGARVEMYEELWFKVPHDYDEAQHIAQWKAAQAEKGFTREVQPR
ncbi:MAG: hypothetical protein IPJ77_15760 [Planctomycetes bacterium]|nr:hypothetical protein [Planctomycetota bacterium]